MNDNETRKYVKIVQRECVEPNLENMQRASKKLLKQGYEIPEIIKQNISQLEAFDAAIRHYEGVMKLADSISECEKTIRKRLGRLKSEYLDSKI